MKIGDKVDIYQDPLTQTRLEGPAELIHLQNENGGVFDGRIVQVWLVRFVGDVRQYSRTILTDITHGEDELA